MKTYIGKSVFGGIAIGKISVYRRDEQQVKRVRIESPEREIERYRAAREEAIGQLKALYTRALREVGEANAAIFEIYQMMLRDEDFGKSIENIIRLQQVNAEYAVASTGDNFSRMFASMDNEYMRSRAADVRDITERLLSVLKGKHTMTVRSEEPVIIAADDLAPSETVQLNKDMVLSFVTVQGSVNSHTAILAKTMGIPALVGTSMPLDETVDGHTAIVDGRTGSIYVDPDEALLMQMKRLQQEEKEQQELLKMLKGKENVTRDGRRISLYANIGSKKDLAAALQNDAGGIGLFRSECIYLEKESLPTEEEQFQIYKSVAEIMAGKPVIIRTLDIGADKKCDYLKMDAEGNPALGCRGIRFCLTRPEIFRTQLRALFRAGAFGSISIMYPMIISVDEVRCLRKIADGVKEELQAQGVLIGELKQGIMIETPAAVMISEELAREADFFSIGTNDLTQYTLAIDRQNPRLDAFCDLHHPAVLRMIQMVVDNAHKAGIPAGICGELGADISLTQTFLKMGVDELSMSPAAILPVRKIVLETDLSK